MRHLLTGLAPLVVMSAVAVVGHRVGTPAAFPHHGKPTGPDVRTRILGPLQGTDAEVLAKLDELGESGYRLALSEPYKLRMVVFDKIARARFVYRLEPLDALQARGVAMVKVTEAKTPADSTLTKIRIREIMLEGHRAVLRDWARDGWSIADFANIGTHASHGGPYRIILVKRTM